MPCPLLMRLHGGCGGGGNVGERAEAEAAGGNCAADRGDSCGGRPFSFQRQVPAVYELELKVPQIQFILCLPDHSCRATVTCAHSASCAGSQNFHGTGAVPGAVDMPVVVQRHVPGCSQRKQLWEFHSCGAQAVGVAAWERKAVFSCFSSHR